MLLLWLSLIVRLTTALSVKLVRGLATRGGTGAFFLPAFLGGAAWSLERCRESDWEYGNVLLQPS